jgi:hypothetical protein
MSDGRALGVLQYLAILLFVSAGLLPLARSQYRWAKWAKWGAIVVFAIAFIYALALVALWAFGS